jgi:hypothetical protein
MRATARSSLHSHALTCTTHVKRRLFIAIREDAVLVEHDGSPSLAPHTLRPAPAPGEIGVVRDKLRRKRSYALRMTVHVNARVRVVPQQVILREVPAATRWPSAGERLGTPTLPPLAPVFRATALAFALAWPEPFSCRREPLTRNQDGVPWLRWAGASGMSGGRRVRQTLRSLPNSKRGPTQSGEPCVVNLAKRRSRSPGPGRTPSCTYVFSHSDGRRMRSTPLSCVAKDPTAGQT